MADLANEMLNAIIIETVDSLPADLLSSYRDPPGRKPSERLRQIHAAIADIDDANVEMLIRDVVDASVFQLTYLISAKFKEAGIVTTIRRGTLAEDLADSLLHEEYRMQIDPGGTHAQP